MLVREIIFENSSRIKYLRPGELSGSYTDKQMSDMGFKKTEDGKWYISRTKWEELKKSGRIR